MTPREKTSAFIFWPAVAFFVLIFVLYGDVQNTPMWLRPFVLLDIVAVIASLTIGVTSALDGDR